MASVDPENAEDSFSEGESYEETGSEENSDSDSDSDSELETVPRTRTARNNGEPCRYYNKGFCRDGNKCKYLHLCKYALKGNCRYGARCQLKHPRDVQSSERGRGRHESTSDETMEDGRCYQWQLNSGKGWKNIANDHVLEAQFSLPHTKGIKIYNTKYGAVCIDFTKMRVRGKRLQVRRLDNGQTVWLWYCRFRRGWIKYEEKDSQGNAGPAPSSEIEKRYKHDANGSFKFKIKSDDFEIKFREMKQIGNQGRRKVRRRPQYQPPTPTFFKVLQQLASGLLGVVMRAQASNGTPEWQFEGYGGRWHTFKSRDECDTNSGEIEAEYQQNPNGTMQFSVSGQAYILDFKAKTQTNCSTQAKRKIRRV